MRNLHSRETETTTISESVVEAVAEAEGVSPVDLTPPLYDVVEPEALDGLFTAPPTDGRLHFTYDGYDVTVRGDGSVSVGDPDE